MSEATKPRWRRLLNQHGGVTATGEEWIPRIQEALTPVLADMVAAKVGGYEVPDVFRNVAEDVFNQLCCGESVDDLTNRYAWAVESVKIVRAMNLRG